MSSLPPPSRRLGKTLSRYIARELVFPTAIALVGLTALVLTKDLLGFSDLVINRGFGAAAVAWIALYEIVPLLARTLPFAVLIGVLVGLGRLRTDLEILVMEAAGISSRQLVRPVLAFAAVMTLAGLLLALSVSPWATRSLEISLQRMAVENPGLSLRAGTVHEFGSVKLVAREVSARGDQLRGVLLWVPDQGQTLFAESGMLDPLSDGSLQLTLYDGVMLPSPRSKGEETRFGMFWKILRGNTASIRRSEDPLAGMAVGRLLEFARAEGDDEGAARRARAELHRRFSYPSACLVFGLLAVPLAVAGRRFSRAAGGVTGLLVTVAYYGLIQLGDGLAQLGLVSAGFGVWLPNLAAGGGAAALLGHERLRLVWSSKVSQQKQSTRSARPGEAHISRCSRYILPRYVARYYAEMLCLSFALLLVGYLLVDVLERLHWFARYHADALKVLRFYGARIPLLAARVIPMSLLLATSLTVSVLSAQRELIGMRACGVSVIRALIPIVLIASVITPGYFLLDEVIVPRSNALADRLKETAIKNRPPETGPLQMMIWYWTSTQVLQAAQLDPQLGEARDLSIYELAANGLPMSRTDARAARHVGNGVWELADPIRMEISEQGIRPMPAEPRIRLGEAPSSALDTMHLSARQLVHEIEGAEAQGYSATAYRVDFHVKLAAPLACLLLPAVALFFAIGGPPFPGPALMLLASTGLGVSYVLFTGVCASLGYGGFLPPSLAGWGPAAGLAALMSLLARRSRG